jgi:Dyp-type peroxidase family
MTLDRGDLQGNILRGYGFRHAGYLFAHMEQADAGRRLLRRLVGPITTEESWDEHPPSTLNVALTACGLKALELDLAAFTRFPAEFRIGMAARAEQLGDVGGSAPEFWDRGLGTGQAHILITVYAPTKTARDERMAFWKRQVDGDGLGLVHEQLADAPRHSREHFGFADGFSQPAVEGTKRDPRGEGVMRRFVGWRRVRLGEFVLGHRDEDGVVVGRELPLLRNGTFMVWRKLEQDVALFRRWIRELARGDPEEEDWLRAKIVGRWPNGDSLVRSPDGHDPGSGRNQFRYGRDLDGRRCPVGAHVRRAYPRDGLGWRTERTKRSRLIRRGMPYGRPLDEGATDPGDEKRGLIFVCLNASIARQFELVQSQWLGDGDAFGLGSARDVLVAQPHPAGRMTVEGSPPRFLSPPGPFVWTRGGEYLFVPGMKALRALATT